jgi:hypothetical protein
MRPAAAHLLGTTLAAAAMLAACDAAPPPPATAPVVFDPDTLRPTTVLTLEDVQGCWWLDCNQPHAEFCIDGGRVYGDFEDEGAATVIANRLMVAFPGGTTLNEHIDHASRERLVLDGRAGRVSYRACP